MLRLFYGTNHFYHSYKYLAVGNIPFKSQIHIWDFIFLKICQDDIFWPKRHVQICKKWIAPKSCLVLEIFQRFLKS